MSTDAKQVGFDPRMVEALICPVTHARLDYDADAQELISRSANLAFPIRNGIPVLLVDEGRPLD
ncbi:MAG: Trm112 family protein [Roseovarius sp.]